MNDPQALERGTAVLKELAEMCDQPAELLFNNNVVRARGGALSFGSIGLHVDRYSDDGRNGRVAAAASLPGRNLKILDSR